VRVSVVDDGSGFDQGNARRGHFGLESMHERAKAVGGDLQLISAPGAGTRVLLTVPATAAIGSSR
jgi:signal transduction histidine kinase